MARENKTRLIVDTSGEALRLAVAEGVFLIKPNLREFAELMGRESVDGLEEERLARELVASGRSEAVVVSLGAAGVLAASAEGAERVRAPLVPIKSKVGAGGQHRGGHGPRPGPGPVLAGGRPLRRGRRRGRGHDPGNRTLPPGRRGKVV